MNPIAPKMQLFFLGWWVLTEIFLSLAFCPVVSGSPVEPAAVHGRPLLSQTSPLPPGLSEQRLRLPETTLSLFIYKPASYLTLRGPLLLVFHGFGRHAREYREAIRPLAEQFGALVVVPEFDRKRFPDARYERGGILAADGSVAPPEDWTFALIPPLIQALRQAEGRADLPCYLLGHSAGGQFVERMAAFAGDELAGVRRIVAANPGSEIFPTRALRFPYGFAGLPRELASNRKLRRYLAQPLTIYLGSEDTFDQQHFDTSSEAMNQGTSRMARGMANFALARRLAARRGWVCNWRLVVAEGVGHDHVAMFDAPAAADALFGTPAPPEPDVGAIKSRKIPAGQNPGPGDDRDDGDFGEPID